MSIKHPHQSPANNSNQKSCNKTATPTPKPGQSYRSTLPAPLHTRRPMHRTSHNNSGEQHIGEHPFGSFSRPQGRGRPGGREAAPRAIFIDSHTSTTTIDIGIDIRTSPSSSSHQSCLTTHRAELPQTQEVHHEQAQQQGRFTARSVPGPVQRQAPQPRRFLRSRASVGRGSLPRRA